MSQLNLPETGVGVLLRVNGLPHIYKQAGFWRIALPRVASLPAREYWYCGFEEVKVFFAHWSQVE